MRQIDACPYLYSTYIGAIVPIYMQKKQNIQNLRIEEKFAPL